MNVMALLFLVVSAVSVWFLPRRWTPVPLLASCCYMTLGQGVELGSLSLPVFRMVLAVALLRVVVKREAVAGGINAIDKLVVVWGAWVIFASLFHEWIPGSGPQYASGFVFNIASVYFLTRIWCRDLTELMAVIRVVAWLLVPVALAMVGEHIFQKNVFAIFGGMPETVPIRDGAIRAQGPFAHPILAGTVGAVCFPLMIGIWRKHSISATVGLAATTTMVLASTSSGPVMSLLLGAFALIMWRFRDWLRLVRWASLAGYIAAGLWMSRPGYYLMARIDLTGSSTGWYRSRLIESAFEHFSEWWAFGTDDTGAWMYNPIDEKHSDITNYYLVMGTVGGFLAMLLFIVIIWRAFVWVGHAVRDTSIDSAEQQFMIWSLGAGMFAHAATSVSVAYFDQSVFFFWLNVGAISAIHSVRTLAAKTNSSPRRGTPGPGDKGAVRFPRRMRAPVTSFMSSRAAIWP